LALATQNNVQLMSYVYPILAFRAPGDYDWLFPCGTNTNGICASLASVKFQDYLIEALSNVVKRTGLGGFAFDYTFFNDPRPQNIYSQWRGWFRILTEVRRRYPSIYIDQRQSAHMYGAWYQMPSTYTEPLAGDENPESYGVQFRSLHTDHVTANHLRGINYVYMMKQMMPIQRIPGFISHQTERSYPNGSLAHSDWNVRDYDLLGFRYSLLSTLATAPCNFIFTMLPARDLAEFTFLPSSEIEFIKYWLAFADANQAALQNAVFLTGPPDPSRIDAIAAFGPTGGYFFLFNTGVRRQFFDFNMTDVVGIPNAKSEWMFVERYPLPGNVVGLVKYGEPQEFHCDPRSARVIQAVPVTFPKLGPVLLGVSGSVMVGTDESEVFITNVGSYAGLTVVANVMNLATMPKTVFVNGKQAKFNASCDTLGHLEVTKRNTCLSVSITFCGELVTGFQEVASMSTPVNGWFNTSFFLSNSLLAQGQKRALAYPIPWTPQDLSASWLLPHRLLLHPVLNPSANPSNVPTLVIDGVPRPLVAGHTGRDNAGSQSSTFTGWYYDCSGLQGNTTHTMALLVPQDANPMQGVFWENIEPEWSNDVC
jgi:hypothetical protein